MRPGGTAWPKSSMPGRDVLTQVTSERGWAGQRDLLAAVSWQHIRNSSSFQVTLMEKAVKETILIIASKQLPANPIVAVCRLFEWLVLVINENIYTDPSVWTSFIGMDIPPWFNSGAAALQAAPKLQLPVLHIPSRLVGCLWV